MLSTGSWQLPMRHRLWQKAPAISQQCCLHIRYLGVRWSPRSSLHIATATVPDVHAQVKEIDTPLGKMEAMMPLMEKGATYYIVMLTHVPPRVTNDLACSPEISSGILLMREVHPLG